MVRFFGLLASVTSVAPMLMSVATKSTTSLRLSVMQSAGTRSHFFVSIPATAVAHSELMMLSLTLRSAAIRFMTSTSRPTYSPLGRGEIRGR